MVALKDFAKKWIKRKQDDIDFLSEFVKIMCCLILIRMKFESRSSSLNAASDFKHPDVSKHWLLYIYVVVPADKAQKQHCLCLQNVLHPMF